MTRAFGLALLISLALTSACEREPVVIQPTPATQLAEQPIPSDLLITLERTWCLGSCPIYKVAIDGSGCVIWKGRDFVDVEGEQFAQVPLDAVRTLMARFESIDFANLRGSYDVSVSDIPSAYVTLRKDGQSKRVRIRGAWFVRRGRGSVIVSGDDESAGLVDLERTDLDAAAIERRVKYAATFEALDQLAEAIDLATSTARWIGDAPSKGRR